MNLKTKIKQKILSLEDTKYKEFTINLCPKTNNIIGVRMPILRNYAKELVKKYPYDMLLNNIDSQYHEEIIIKGMIICLYQGNFSKAKKYIEDYIPLISNWAICDTFCLGLKNLVTDLTEVRIFILQYKHSTKEFELRFMLVMLLNYYTEEEYLEDNFKIFDEVTTNHYYTQMALAWAISISLIKFFDQTISYLKKCKLDNFVFNKAISKACDSYQLNSKQKDFLRTMKR